MQNTRTEWRVHPHGPVDEISPTVWRVEGSLPKMPLKRVMTVVHVGGGDLVVHNGIAVDERTREAIEAWGRPRWLLVPNGYHRADAAAYRARYPGIAVLCPRGSRKKVEEVVSVDGVYEDFPSTPEVSVETLDGVGELEGVVVARHEGGTTLVLNDIVFNLPHLPGGFGFLYRMLRQTGRIQIPFLAKLFLVKDKRALAAHLRRLSDEPNLRSIIVSHVSPITQKPADELRRLARGLDGN